MTRTVAVTGATGFIGSTLAKHLHRSGWNVRVLVRPNADERRLGNTPVERITGSLDNPASLRALVSGTDAVVHCAGAVRGATRADFDRVNVAGVEQLVNAVSEQGTSPAFLLISSLAAREPRLSAYAASKRDGERVLQTGSSQMRWNILRPPAVYGPGDSEMLPLFRLMQRGIAPITGTRNARLSLLYVDDLADASLQIIDHPEMRGGIYELHDGREQGYSWNDIVGTVRVLRGSRIVQIRIPLLALRIVSMLNLAISLVFKRSPMLTPGKVREISHPDWVCDNHEFSQVTGWKPAILLEEGLRRTLGLSSGNLAAATDRS